MQVRVHILRVHVRKCKNIYPNALFARVRLGCLFARGNDPREMFKKTNFHAIICRIIHTF